MTAGRVSEAAPLRFLLAVIAIWVAARGAMLAEWQPASATAGAAQAARPTKAAEIQVSLDPVVDDAGATIATPDQPHASPMAQDHAIAIALDDAEARDGATDSPLARPPVQLALLDEQRQAAGTIYRGATGLAEAAPVAARPARAGSHWSGSAWAFLRGGGRATALSPGGQIGGGQAGARLLYHLRPGGQLALSTRISGTIGGIRQTEAAVGVDWQPIKSVPVHLMAERRIAIDQGGRNAWTLGAAGGLYAVPLGGHWRFDGYAEAGVVGARRRDLYADGAARIARAIDLGGGKSLALGGGLWAAAQPRVARVDIGPSAVLRMPVAGRTVSLALDWREQVAGRARPRSGIAFTTAVDF